MYARFWDYNLGKPKVQEFKGVKSEIEVEFVGSDKDYYIQRDDEKCQFLSDVSVLYYKQWVQNEKRNGIYTIKNPQFLRLSTTLFLIPL